jgi:Na+/alanine symporter
MAQKEDRSTSIGGLDENIASHIFTVSAALVGVCLTVIGLFRISDRLKDVSDLGQILLSVDAGAFLVSCMLSYVVLRTRRQQPQHRIEQVADGIFLVALSLMAAICGLITYELV